MSLKHALLHNSTRCDEPFLHWLIDQPFSADVLREVTTTVIPDVRRVYDGTRAGDAGGGAVKTRCFITPQNVEEFPAMGGLVDELLDVETIERVEGMLSRSMHGAYLRVEVIADREGFWLKPHKDIQEKLMSMLLYVNPHGESENLGTDFYDESLRLVKTMKYRDNYGYMFAPAHNTWHGLERKPIRKERRSVLINYVTFETEWKLPQRRQRAAA